ncbi:hypothetical protein [Bradyrhizobium sp. STM 3562]|uniref:hypothetical protein n=1 Tax=Bradyrhizobium sp. STM 3562 TaxID=578924 RepID=UPI003890058E
MLNYVKGGTGLNTSGQSRVLAHSHMQAQPSARDSKSSFRPNDQKIIMYLLAGLIVSAMAGWLGFIGWGLVVVVKRLLAF